MASVKLEKVCKEFQLKDGTVLALKDVACEIGDREFVSLIGPSGCGKSTVLRLIAGLLAPTSGDIHLHGLSPAIARSQRLYAFVFQDPVMFPWRTVVKNVEMPLEVVGGKMSKERANRAQALLELVGLQGFEKATPNQLSGGMKHRAAIARALMLEPPVLLMDEPFGALDEITRDRMNLELLRIWGETNAAVIFVTHSIEEAVFLSDRILVLSPRPGTIVADIQIDLPRPRTLLVKQSEQAFSYSTQVRKKLTEITIAAEMDQFGAMAG
jgi:NitT/TauT family transport system ATP-binding protein